MRVLGFLGRSGSGKTTLIERLLPALAARGLRVAVVKHAHHSKIELEPAGKDTRRFREAGAAAVALVAPDQIFTLEPRTTEPTLDEVLSRLPPTDLVIVESWRALGIDYLAVIGDSGEPPSPRPGARCIGVVTDARSSTFEPSTPRAPRDADATIVGWITGWLAS